MYWSCNGKMCLFIPSCTLCTVQCTLQLAAFAYWLKQINANAYKTMYVHMHKINAIVFSLHSVHSHSHSSCVLCAYILCICGICFRIQLCIQCNTYINCIDDVTTCNVWRLQPIPLSLLPSLAFSLLYRLCTLLKAFFRPFLNC